MKQITAVTILWVFLAFASTLTNAVTCSGSFIPLGEHCYFFSNPTTSKWPTAREECRSLDSTSDLAVFDLTCEDYYHVFNYLSNSGITTTNCYWIGGSEFGHLNYWTWVDGRPVDLIKSYWEYGQPSNNTGLKYMALCNHTETYYNRWRFINQDGNTLYPYICESGVAIY